MHEPASLTRRAAAALPLAALLGSAAAAMPTTAGADAELVDLGRRWQAALAAEQTHDRINEKGMTSARARAHDAIGDKLYDVRSALFGEIERTPATAAAGLAVKARILAYENDIEMDEASIAAALAATPYFQDRAALSLALDCLRMARAAA